jgi:hypothetical protein
MKEKINPKRLGITIGIVLLTALVVGGAVWYVKDKEIKELNQTNSLEKLETLAASYCELTTRPSDDELITYAKGLPGISDAKIEVDKAAGRILRIGYFPFDGGDWADQGWNLECGDTEQAATENREGTQEEGASGPNTFDVTTVKVGDKVMGLTVSKVNKINNDEPIGLENAGINFTGQKTLTGTYEINSEDVAILGGQTCFYPNDDSSALMPIMKGETRDTWFCFTNTEAANTLLSKGGTKGTATVVISDYYIIGMGASVWNTAKIISVK